MDCLNQPYSDIKSMKTVILCRTVIRIIISRINFFSISVSIWQGVPYTSKSAPITFSYGSTPLVCPSPTGIISIKRISVPFWKHTVWEPPHLSAVWAPHWFSLLFHTLWQHRFHALLYEAAVFCDMFIFWRIYRVQAHIYTVYAGFLKLLCMLRKQYCVCGERYTPDTGYLLICKTISSICGCRSGSPPVRRKCVIPSLVAARTMQSTFLR